MGTAIEDFIAGLPKAELHMHLEGSLEPEMLLDLSRRNRVQIPFDSVDAVREAYRFVDLQSFLDAFYRGARVLLGERDFFDLTSAYLEKVSAQNVRHAEVFFDPQIHTDRGVPFEAVVTGIHRALEAARERLGVTSRLIACFVRHQSEDRALEALEQVLRFRNWVTGVGLDSSELGHPPGDFVRLFARAREAGLRVVAHAGEEGPPDYVWQALDLLGAERIDHGVRSLEDPRLIERLVRERVPLTVCPLSNVRLQVFASMAEHNLKRLLDAGVMVTLNSDDPAYFGGYLNENYLAAQRALDLSRDDLARLAAHGFRAAFLPDEERDAHLEELERYRASR
jgi:adenosine deaminase